jgi:proprotein convertase subtilisin/kexin type 5
VACDNSCQNCNGPYAENCSSCKITTYWFVSICVSSNKCPNGTYANSYGSASSAPVCTICSVNLNCYTCYYNTTSSAVLCNSCKVGYYINTTTGVCSSSCPSNYFASTATSTCIQCDLSCLTCSSTTNSSCITCPVNINVLKNSTGTYCLGTCPTQYYYNNGSNYCKQCYSSCITCSGGAISSNIFNYIGCLSCVSNMYLNTGHCYYFCPVGTYPDNTTYTCLACNSTCTYCFGGSNSQCNNCTKGYVLSNTTCVNSCPGNLSANSWGVCWESNLLVLLITLWTMLLI